MKNVFRTLLSTALIASGLTFAFVSKTETKVDAANPNKITICHRTAAVKNPYRRITVNFTAIASDITKNGGTGHGQWSHNLWPTHVADLDDAAKRPDPNVFNPDWKTTLYTTATQKRWGDIIPTTIDRNRVAGTPLLNRAAAGLNYKDEGLAIYNGTTFDHGGTVGIVDYAGLCGRQTAAQFCESLINEGGTLAECQAELAEMGALEDLEVLKQCGGSFTACSIEKMSVINVRTVGASCAANVPTFSGSASTGSLANDVSFEYGTDANLVTSTLIAATPGSIAGSGTFTATVTAGLTDGTYYYRAVAIEPIDEGRLDGSIASFTVTNGECGGFLNAEPPSVTTLPPTSVQPTTATLNGTASSNGATTAVTFEYLPLGGVANCAAVNFSTPVSVTATASLNSDAVDSAQTFNLTGLSAGTTYCYRIKGSNTPGSATGGLEEFTTSLVAQPVVTTTAATLVTSETATLNGTGTPNGAETTAKFTYKAGSSDFSTGATTQVLTPTIGTGSSAVSLSLNLTGLTPGTTYYFKASVSNANTNNTYIDGVTLSFTTPVVILTVQPVVTTTAATLVTSETATLNGTGTPNGAETTARFTYKAGSSDFSSGATTEELTPTIGTGSSAVALSLNLTGLTPGTTYYFMASVSNANTNNAFIDGVTLSFTTESAVQTSSNTPTTPSTSPTTTVNPPTNAAAVTGALKGVVWIDQNRNGKQDSNEPGLPFTPIVAEVSSSSVSGQSLNKAGVATSRVRKYAINATTDANGFYDVPSLDPGRWSVTATLQTSALEKTFDSTNGSTTNWFASAVVPVNGVGEADFAAAGNAQVALDVQPTEACVKTNTVEVQWAGIDAKMKNSDDVVFLATVKNQESLVKGLPWGSYLVTPICSNGTRLAPQPLVITKAQANAKTVSKMSVQLASARLLELPATGQTSGNTSSAFAALLILAGVALMLLPRRRRAN